MAPSDSPLTHHPLFSPPIHQSCLNCWVGCKRKCLYIYKFGLQPKRPPLSESLTVGSLTHSILYCGPKDIYVAEAHKNEVISLLNQQIESGEDAFGDNAARIQLIEDSWSKSLAIANILWERFPPNPNHVLIAGEEYLSVTLPSGIRIAGTLDRIIHNTTDDTYWIRDYKVTGRDISCILSGYRWASQPWFYKLLLEHHLKKPCNGFILDVIQRPTIRLSGEDCDFEIQIGPRGGKTRVKTSEPKLVNYLSRCRAWYKDKGDEACRSFSEIFPPIYYQSLLPDIEPQLRELYSLLNSDEAVSLYEWPRDVTGHNCYLYERPCEYYPLCNASPNAWPALIDLNYRVVNPDQAHDLSKSEE